MDELMLPDYNTTKLLWYRYSQNNSGGRFIMDHMVADEVFIQAASAEEANAYAGFIFGDEGRDEYCKCCGPRWGVAMDDGSDEPMIYDMPLKNVTSDSCRKEARLHYANGRVETYIFMDEVEEE